MTAVLEVSELSVRFATDRGWVTVVEDVSFAVEPGSTLGLVGESGSGKTVTSLALLGLLPARTSRISSGSIRLGGTELIGMPRRTLEDVRGNDIAMIFQEPMSSLNPAFTIGDQIAETVRRHRGLSRKQAAARAVAALEQVGIPNAARRARGYPHEFSGGMRQRAMIAMAICCEPKVLVADEPTTALDVTIQAQVLDLLRDMRDALGMGMVFITHDLGVVADICDQVVVMYAGQVVAADDVGHLFRQPPHPYAEGLLAAMPQLGDAGPLATIPGHAPAPGALPDGCRFHPRCPYATDDCTASAVPLRDLGAGRATRCVRTDEIELRGPA
ncbi:ABC transporter ATP-binding protein [Saccharopolyspora sp. CA-218241]|uniref:ABC transporter ATP-binding protein n=1 Tax=Saccharopolyspora sp. CA-218241 TaxID=3240027 RepID=UPI003D99B54E